MNAKSYLDLVLYFCKETKKRGIMFTSIMHFVSGIKDGILTDTDEIDTILDALVNKQCIVI
jgi:hypothetical protein